MDGWMDGWMDEKGLLFANAHLPAAVVAEAVRLPFAAAKTEKYTY